jgi:hypothetical protein
MKYLGIVKRQNCVLTMPDGFEEVAQGREYEAIQVEDGILLVPAPLDRERLRRIEQLANRSIEEHRKTLEGLHG